ncbi:MAG: hypothetical protein V4731_13555 [Pseudomonadota bacterium]
MTAYLLANHLLNLLAPAVFVAFAVMVLTGLIMGRRISPAQRTTRQRAVRFFVLVGVNLLVILAGLVLFRQDGKLMTYSALVLAAAACQWVLIKGWKGGKGGKG